MKWLNRILGRDPKKREEHREALHAEARAIEDKKKTEGEWLDILVMKAHLSHLNERNHFGERLELALRRRR